MPSESSSRTLNDSESDDLDRIRSGRILATPLISVPDRATRPDYYAVVTDPTSLDIVQSRAESDYYREAQEFDKDLLHVFTTAKIFIRPNTPGTYWGDLLQLQVRLYFFSVRLLRSERRPDDIDPCSNCIKSSRNSFIRRRRTIRSRSLSARQWSALLARRMSPIASSWTVSRSRERRTESVSRFKSTFDCSRD